MWAAAAHRAISSPSRAASTRWCSRTCSFARRGRLGGALVCAVHINYANRAESDAEEEYLRRWCSARRVPLLVRRVDEIRRGTTPREQYERESRRIRFDAYREAMAQFGAGAVLFGHHLGDLQENVVSNVMKRANVLDIGGIAEVSLIDGVPIWRPMLPHPKSAIYCYAHSYGVPYFKDTTPKWSTRGRLRNELLPLLASIYGEGFAGNLSALARESARCAELLESQLFRAFKSSVRASPLAVWFDTAPWASLPDFFWRCALRHVCEKRLGIGMVKDRAVGYLLKYRLGQTAALLRRLAALSPLRDPHPALRWPSHYVPAGRISGGAAWQGHGERAARAAWRCRQCCRRRWRWARGLPWVAGG